MPEKDWNGEIFMVLGKMHATYTQFNSFEITTDAMNGEVLNDALLQRNATLSEQYNVKFAQELYTNQENNLTQAAAAGEDLYDLVFLETGKIGPLTQQGMFYDMNKVQYIDFTKPWWNPDVNDSLSILNKVYFTSSDHSLRDKNRAYILLYNPQFAADNKIPDLVTTVREGKWTVDLMAQYNEAVSADLDGDGNLTDKDAYGVTMDSYNSFAAFYTGCDNVIVSKDNTGKPVIQMNTQRTVDTIDKLIKAICNPKIAVFCENFRGKVDYDFWSVSGIIFNNGNSLITASFPHSLPSKSEKCDFDYTVIPFPKFDENQEKYITLAAPACMLFSIPITSATPDFSGFMLEALSYASTNTTLKTYYEVVCKSKYSSNEVSAEMLDVIFDGIRYDFDKLYDIGLFSILSESIPGAGENVFSSVFASRKDAAQSKIDQLYETISKLDN